MVERALEEEAWRDGDGLGRADGGKDGEGKEEKEWNGIDPRGKRNDP